jgi:hypothetical protein
MTVYLVLFIFLAEAIYFVAQMKDFSPVLLQNNIHDLWPYILFSLFLLVGLATEGLRDRRIIIQ